MGANYGVIGIVHAFVLLLNVWKISKITNNNKKKKNNRSRITEVLRRGQCFPYKARQKKLYHIIEIGTS